ncbi:amino acid:proton symporter, partial [Streptomyces noursei]
LWLSVLSALGSTEFGGHGVLPGGVDVALVGISALAFYFWAVRAGVQAHREGLTDPDPVPAPTHEPDPEAPVMPGQRSQEHEPVPS